VNEAILLMQAEIVTHASLDRDLGDFNEDGGEGYRLVPWMAEHDSWPTHGIRVHSGASILSSEAVA
jgi:NAD+-processing family protein with receiver domain